MMFSSSSLISTLLLALAVAAKPIVVVRESKVTLPFALKLNNTGMGTIPAIDRARAAALRASANKVGKRDGISFDVTNTAVSGPLFQLRPVN